MNGIPTPTVAVTAPKWAPDNYEDSEPPAWVALEGGFPVPEDRGLATLSPLGSVEYVEDLVRPGRIVVVAAEEGTGKSYATASELGLRVAVAGGAFAGAWRVLRNGPVLYLSEMHPDDDYEREAVVLASLGLAREDIQGNYFRLSLATAAGDTPALRSPEWREWVVRWLRDHGVLVAIFDTATGATGTDPWGPEFHRVYHDLRAMLDGCPMLAILLVVHLKKPSGRGPRRITDVIGEWGRWCDVILLLEADGLDRVKLTSLKRVRQPRRIVARKSGGLLVDPQDRVEGGPKVPLNDVVAAIHTTPGLSQKALAKRLAVSAATARTYVTAAERAGLIRVESRADGLGKALYPAEEGV